jgi:hypothetical protein
LVDGCKNPNRLWFPWNELEELKRRIVKLESCSDVYEEMWEVRTLNEMDNIICAIRKEMERYGIARVTVEKHDEN